jgi:hypothetical protein
MEVVFTGGVSVDEGDSGVVSSCDTARVDSAILSVGIEMPVSEGV